MTIKVH